MHSGKKLPQVELQASLSSALAEMSEKGLGMTTIIDNEHKICGIFTDGDLRRLIADKKSIVDLTVEDVMTKNPRTVTLNSPAYDALNMMEKHQITVLPITNTKGKVQGILHLHDILGKGEFKFNGT